MLFREIWRLLGYFFFGFALTLLVPLGVAIYYDYWIPTALHPQPATTGVFAVCFIICLLIAATFRTLGSKAQGHLYLREALASVAFIWLFTPMIGGLPFYLSNTLKNPLHCYFESISGFTTTGATTMIAKAYDSETGAEIPRQKVIPGVYSTKYIYYGTIDPVRDPETGTIIAEGVEAVSKPLLFWRSFQQWLGGMGIIVLFVAILPALGIGGKMLLHAEMPGPIKDSLTPRIKETAAHFWKIYVGLTILQIAILQFTNPAIDWFDASTISFSTLSTGGFSTRNMSIGSFANVHTDWVVIAFMVLGSLNFTLYFHAFRGKIYRIYEPEFLVYILILFCTCSFATLYLTGTPNILLNGVYAGDYTVSEAVRYGTFQLISAQTSTGFVTTDYDWWPYPTQTLMLIVMYLGGMSGSTAGGMKIIRPYMLFRILQTRVESMFRPNAVRTFKIGHHEIDSGVALTVLCFFLTLISFAVLGSFLYIIDGIDPETAISLVTCMINNIGIAFRMDGPTESCAFLSNFSILTSCLWMVLGRLEFFAILVILVPAFWKENV